MNNFNFFACVQSSVYFYYFVNDVSELETQRIIQRNKLPEVIFGRVHPFITSGKCHFY